MLIGVHMQAVHFPNVVRSIAKQCADRNPTSVPLAVDQCLEEVRKLDGYHKWRDSLVAMALQKLIHESRHDVNVAIKNASGQYGGPAKVKPGIETAGVIVASYFDYRMAGTRLGDLRFADLPKIASDNRARAGGYIFNAKLCEAIYAKRPKDETAKIEAVLKETDVRKLFVALKSAA